MAENIDKDAYVTKDIFFQNGAKYTTSIYCNGRLIKLSKYFSNGKLSQVYEYKEGKLLNRNIYGRDGGLLEKYTYSYHECGIIASIIKERTNSILSVTFILDNDTQNIISIRIRHNNVIIRKLDYEYSNSKIICSDATQDETEEYQVIKPPIADESWLVLPRPNSIVMRKLLVAMSIGC